jgi:hypothetical protein
VATVQPEESWDVTRRTIDFSGLDCRLAALLFKDRREGQNRKPFVMFLGSQNRGHYVRLDEFRNPHSLEERQILREIQARWERSARDAGDSGWYCQETDSSIVEDFGDLVVKDSVHVGPIMGREMFRIQINVLEAMDISTLAPKTTPKEAPETALE